jgi:hypothetical protein
LKPKKKLFGESQGIKHMKSMKLISITGNDKFMMTEPRSIHLILLP